jgi:ATP-dependent Clp protease ATP-binding subunit ClpA
MLFNEGVFSPQTVQDPRARLALVSAVTRDADVLGPRDLLACILRQEDEAIQVVLAKGTRVGRSPQDLLAALDNGHVAREQPLLQLRSRASFTPDALHALDDFARALDDSGGTLDRVALEVLLLCVLARLDGPDREALADLDVDKAARLLARRVGRGIDFHALLARAFASTPQEEDEDEGPDEAVSPSPVPPEVAGCEDLTERARACAGPGPFPFDGEPAYDRLFAAFTRALHRRQARHVLLVGERGVAKTTVVAELARRAACGQAASLAGLRFLHVDCRHAPPDEARARLVGLLDAVAPDPSLVVAVDGLAGLIGQAAGGGNKAVLLSALPHLACRLVALLTPREFEEHFSGEPDLNESFSRVDVFEPDPEAALKLLRRYSLGLEEKFGVAIDDQAVRQAVVLSANYVLHDQLPAKALKVLSRACEDLDYERTHLGGDRPSVTAEDVVRVVSETSGVPQDTLRGVAGRADYGQSLREFIVGQEHAVREVAAELGLIKAGMTDPGKPASVMLFLGQTGTGKTETAKALARIYSGSGRLRTYTLGNCVEPHSVSTVIGVPPGYVGHDQGGRLVNDLNADPYCVFLLDEADKAHPDVLQPFLNLFDEGWVTDQRGVKAYADKAVFILTTNVGQRMIAELAQQGHTPEQIAARMKEALAQIRHPKAERPVFTPEFLARVKRIIVFESLDQPAMEGIARKLVRELRQSWAERRGKSLDVPERLVLHLAGQGHRLNQKSSGKEGGRIVRKLLADLVESPLQRAISAGPDEYRACEAVAVDFTPPAPGPDGQETAAPAVAVRFLPAPRPDAAVPG